MISTCPGRNDSKPKMSFNICDTLKKNRPSS
jgi:hypothetical protein